MCKEKWRNYFFRVKPIEIPDKWVLLRNIGKDILSKKAQEKLEWIIFYYNIAEILQEEMLLDKKLIV